MVTGVDRTARHQDGLWASALLEAVSRSKQRRTDRGKPAQGAPRWNGFATTARSDYRQMSAARVEGGTMSFFFFCARELVQGPSKGTQNGASKVALRAESEVFQGTQQMVDSTATPVSKNKNLKGFYGQGPTRRGPTSKGIPGKP